MKHHIYTEERRGYPILPIGVINLTTGKSNGDWDLLWDCWESDANASNILCFDIEKMKYMAVHTSGKNTQYKDGDIMEFSHDQTFRKIGTTWKVIGTFPHTINGNAAMKRECGKASISFATFK